MNKQPNIVYILADDMGYGDVSCLNKNSKIHTESIDKVATKGMIFRDAHASSAVCTPSRYSILTGRYNWRSLLKKDVLFGYSKPLIEPGRMTVASFLKEQGYTTACMGKWHLGWTWPMKSTSEEDVDFEEPILDGPTTVGFDSFFGISASLDMPPYVYVENNKVTAIPDRIIPENKGKMFWREGPIAPDFKHEDVLPKLADKAIGFIEEKAQENKPFFLYLPLPAPHTPILPSPEFQGKSGTNEYGDFCLQVDDVVGQICNTIDQLELTEDTILLFTSDNGCSPRADYNELADVGHHPSYVFRGHKADIYEGGHRVPFIVRWPSEITEGSVCDETICLVDLLATCANILNVSLPNNAGEDSMSNLDIWRGKSNDSSVREAIIHHSIDGSFSIRKGKWKLEMCPGSGGWSYPRPESDYFGLPSIQLYNLDTDISECWNVYKEHPEVVESLQSLLTQYVINGRSTPGVKQNNFEGVEWEQLWWMIK